MDKHQVENLNWEMIESNFLKCWLLRMAFLCIRRLKTMRMMMMLTMLDDDNNDIDDNEYNTQHALVWTSLMGKVNKSHTKKWLMLPLPVVYIRCYRRSYLSKCYNSKQLDLISKQFWSKCFVQFEIDYLLADTMLNVFRVWVFGVLFLFLVHTV